MDERMAVRVTISSLNNYVADNSADEKNKIVDKTEYVYPGEYWTKEGKHFFNFVEEVEGIKIVNRVLATSTSAIIDKSGDDKIKSHLKFANSLKYGSEYKIPYGTFYMEVDTKEYNLEVFSDNQTNQKDVLFIYICYDVYMNEQYISRNNINIKVDKIL